jgi:hypothetical protein
MRNPIVQLGIDLANRKVQDFSALDANEKLRVKFDEMMGGYSTKSKKEQRQLFRLHKEENFTIIEEVLNETIHEGLKSQFDGFADYRNLEWGDENLFKVPANNIFRVALVSDGTNNLRRQKLRDGQEFSISLDTYGVKVGEDFHRFLANRVDWAEFISGIAESFRRDLTARIYKAVLASYQKFNATYHTSGTLTEDKLVELAQHITARTGEQVEVYGTKLALRVLAPSNISDKMKDDKNALGYYGEIAGIKMFEIEQSHDYGTDTFAISDKMILVLPQSKDKFVKVVNEGDAVICDQAGGQTADMMQEYSVFNKFGVSVITSKVFGFWMLP